MKKEEIIEITKEKFNWELIVSLVLVIATILGTNIPLYLHTSSQIDAIQKEMRDFHGRLERQDAEFKAHLMYQHKEIENK